MINKKLSFLFIIFLLYSFLSFSQETKPVLLNNFKNFFYSKDIEKKFSNVNINNIDSNDEEVIIHNELFLESINLADKAAAHINSSYDSVNGNIMFNKELHNKIINHQINSIKSIFKSYNTYIHNFTNDKNFIRHLYDYSLSITSSFQGFGAILLDYYDLSIQDIYEERPDTKDHNKKLQNALYNLRAIEREVFYMSDKEWAKYQMDMHTKGKYSFNDKHKIVKIEEPKVNQNVKNYIEDLNTLVLLGLYLADFTMDQINQYNKLFPDDSHQLYNTTQLLSDFVYAIPPVDFYSEFQNDEDLKFRKKHIELIANIGKNFSEFFYRNQSLFNSRLEGKYIDTILLDILQKIIFIYDDVEYRKVLDNDKNLKKNINKIFFNFTEIRKNKYHNQKLLKFLDGKNDEVSKSIYNRILNQNNVTLDELRSIMDDNVAIIFFNRDPMLATRSWDTDEEYNQLPYHSYFLNVITKKNNEIFTIVDKSFDLEKISNKIIPFLNIDSCNVKIKGDRARRVDKTQFEWLRESTFRHNFGFSNQTYKLDKHYIKIYSQDLSNEDYSIIMKEYKMQKERGWPLQSLLNKEKITKIIIIPDSNYWAIPFDVLGSFYTKEAHGFDYLIEKFQISYQLSAFHYFISKKNSDRKYDYDYIGYGNADYSSLKKDLKISKSESSSLLRSCSWNNLRYSNKEIKEPLKYKKLSKNHKLISGEKANEKALKNSFNSKIIHLAIHSSSKNNINNNPVGAALITASDELNDGIVTLDELYKNSEFKSDLVILSSCESGIGEVKNNFHEFESLSLMFKILGSSQVIYSLWKVDDKSTYLFFEKFYQYLATGLTASESLHKTKLYFIDSDDPKLKDPYVWAAFNIIGY